MASTAEKRVRAEAMLGELAEHALMVAKDLAVRARETEDHAQAAALADAFQKVSRVVRLTLALDFKLDRDVARDAREAAREAERIAAGTAEAEQAQAKVAAAEASRAAKAEAAALPDDPLEARAERVYNLMKRLLWNEAEGEEEDYDFLTNELSARLDEAARSPDFETLPIETLARRMIADMGLSGHLTLSLCEPPSRQAEPSLPARRSSA
jgi:hypothetical protein